MVVYRDLAHGNTKFMVDTKCPVDVSSQAMGSSEGLGRKLDMVVGEIHWRTIRFVGNKVVCKWSVWSWEHWLTGSVLVRDGKHEGGLIVEVE